jgi:CBS domain-containing protein/nucleotide-binding universal stress UspA family protein
MRVAQWMTRNPVTISPKESLVLARMIMRQRGVRRLPVVEGERLVGIVTDRDVREAWASDANTLAAQELQYVLEKIPVRDVMTAPVTTVAPETPLEEAVTLMREKKIGGLPVEEGDRLVGILSETDVFRAFAEVLHYGNVEARRDRPPQAIPPAGKLLVPVLGTPLSPKVVKEAARLSAQLGLSPKLLLVMPGTRHLDDIRTPGDTRAFDEIIAGLLAEYRGIAKSEGVEIEAEFVSGEPAAVVLDEINRGQYDFAVAGRKNPIHLGLSRLELEKNGFAARLLEASPVPVLVVSEAVQV